MAPKIAVIFYSMYGHTLKLSEKVVESAKEDGAEVSLYQIPETLPQEVLDKMYAAPKRNDIPTITPDALVQYDGFIFVIPTRYGRAVSQVSTFFDATGGLWAKQSLSKKFATVLTSTASQNGGQETTAFTTLPWFAHHGISFVPLGYGDPGLFNMEEVHGGAPWGAGTIAGGDGSRQPSEVELASAAGQAKRFVDIVSQFTRGGERLELEKAGAAKAQEVSAVKKEASGQSASSSPSGSTESKKKNRFSVHGIIKGIKKRL